MKKLLNILWAMFYGLVILAAHAFAWAVLATGAIVTFDRGLAVAALICGLLGIVGLIVMEGAKK